MEGGGGVAKFVSLTHFGYLIKNLKCSLKSTAKSRVGTTTVQNANILGFLFHRFIFVGILADNSFFGYHCNYMGRPSLSLLVFESTLLGFSCHSV